MSQKPFGSSAGESICGEIGYSLGCYLRPQDQVIKQAMPWNLHAKFRNRVENLFGAFLHKIPQIRTNSKIDVSMKKIREIVMK